MFSSDPNFADPSGDYHLFPGSPCIEGGDNAVAADLLTDLDGTARRIDGDCDSQSTVDIGAYEFDPIALGDFNADCRIDLEDFGAAASVWMTTGCADCRPEDMNEDGEVNLEDLVILFEYWLADF